MTISGEERVSVMFSFVRLVVVELACRRDDRVNWVWNGLGSRMLNFEYAESAGC